MNDTKIEKVPNQVNVPQPHVTIVTRRKYNIHCSGWVPFLLIGVAAILFLFITHYFGGSALFPVTKNLYAGLVPIVKKGYLQTLPFTVDSNTSIQDTFFIKLPLEESEKTKYVQTLDQLLKKYPDKLDDPYRNCWLQNPSRNHPCYFDPSWISKFCERNHSYGYDSEKNEFNPCFIFKFENTQDWKPTVPYLPSFFNPTYGYPFEDFDHGFLPVVCMTETNSNAGSGSHIAIYPPKGFSLLFFPKSDFNDSLHLSPLVAVKVRGIQRNQNLTITCSIVSLNAFTLWNNGRITITFSSS